MLRAYSFLLLFCAGLIVAFYAQKFSHAQSIEEQMAAPRPVQIHIEAIASPEGLIHCYNINDGFLYGKWVTKHRICQYAHDQSMAWVEEHWTCYTYNKDNGCMTWIKWSTGWYNTISVVKTYIVKSRSSRYSLDELCCEADSYDTCEY